MKPTTPPLYLYKVSYGLICRDEVIANWSSKNVIAKNAKHAIARAGLRKKHVSESVELIAEVNVP